MKPTKVLYIVIRKHSKRSRNLANMDKLAKNLFADFGTENTSPLPKPFFSAQPTGLPCPNILKFDSPTIMAREQSSPKSSDSFMEELGGIDEFISPEKNFFSPENQQPNFSCSPPCLNKGFLNLRLFDTPHTPKTLFTKLKKASIEEKDPTIMKSPSSTRHGSRTSLRAKFMRKDLASLQERKRPQTEPRLLAHKNVVYANFNPFTPNSEVQMKAKRPRIQLSRYRTKPTKLMQFDCKSFSPKSFHTAAIWIKKECFLGLDCCIIAIIQTNVL